MINLITGFICGVVVMGYACYKVWLEATNKVNKELYCECEAPEWLSIDNTDIVCCKKCFKDKKQ